MGAKQYEFGLAGAQGRQAAAQDWQFLEESRLPGSWTLLDRDKAIAGQRDAVWKCLLVGHTHLQAPWIRPLPLFLLFPYLFFGFVVESKPAPFLIRGRWQWCALCHGCRVQDERKKLAEGRV